MILLFFVLLQILHMSTGQQYHTFTYNTETFEVDSHGMYGVDESPEIEYMNRTFHHAESPTWDPEAQTLYWVDVLEQNVHALDYTTAKHKVKHLDCGEVNVAIPIMNSDKMLVGCQSKIYVMDWNHNHLKEIAYLDSHTRYNIFNEGKCDAYGRLWAGTKGPQKGDVVSMNMAVLYKVEQPCYKPKPLLRPVTISNGLVWSLNNSLLYYIDSATNKIEAFDFDLAKGQISGRRTILDTTQWGYHDPVPDGMTIDRDGFLWIALFFYGQVIRVDPDNGRIVRVYDLPVPRVTSVAWAGDALDQLVVTTSKRNVQDDQLEEFPLAGSIFLLKRLGTTGLTDNKFNYDSQDLCLD